MGSMVPTRLGPIARLESEALRRDAIEAFAKAIKRAPGRARPSYEEHLKELRKISEGPGEETSGDAEAEQGDRLLRLAS
jgi:vacuolar-type H+-ATPase subunit H